MVRCRTAAGTARSRIIDVASRRRASGRCPDPVAALRSEAMAESLSGTLYGLEDHFLYVGPLLRSELHAHHAGQIMWVPAGISLQTDQASPRSVTFSVIAPDQPHEHGAAPLAAVLWLDGDDARWRPRLDESSRASSTPAIAEIGSIDGQIAQIGSIDGALSLPAAQALADRLLRAFAPDVAPSPGAERHPAVLRMCALLDAGSTTPSHELSLTQLARRSGLSERQLREVFVRDTGLTPRAYLRWRRIRRAVASIREGASLTMAAMDAGFADGPHFSRVFHAQFGMSPHRAFASMRFGGALAIP